MSVLATPASWNDAPIGDLIDHIVTTYHRPLPEALTHLAVLARHAFGDVFDERIAELRDLLIDHTHREEELVFPWLRRRNQRGAGILVNLLEHEHGDAVLALRELCDLARAGVATEPRWQAELAAHLRELEAVLREHVRLENRVLFPRALAADSSSE